LISSKALVLRIQYPRNVQYIDRDVFVAAQHKAAEQHELDQLRDRIQIVQNQIDELQRQQRDLQRELEEQPLA
jgi:chaperonin cofactor prefoldin